MTSKNMTWKLINWTILRVENEIMRNSLSYDKNENFINKKKLGSINSLVK